MTEASPKTTPTERVAQAAQVVDAQLLAYNARDLDALEGCFTSSVEIWSEGALVAKGLEELRDLYAHQFATLDVQAVVTTRSSVGDWVVDVEELTGIGAHALRALVAYRIRGRLIDEMRLLTATADPEWHCHVD